MYIRQLQSGTSKRFVWVLFDKAGNPVLLLEEPDIEDVGAYFNNIYAPTRDQRNDAAPQFPDNEEPPY